MLDTLLEGNQLDHNEAIMSLNKLVSVLMICYNQEKYISEAVDSVLGQTYTEFELIIVDDGSTDRTFELLQEYDDARISIFQQSNSGPSMALNYGLRQCRGEYIAFMSGDDVALSDRLKTQLKQIGDDQVDIVFSLPLIIDENSDSLEQTARPEFFNTEFNTTAELYKLLFFGNFLCAPSAFCRRSAIEAVGSFRRGLIQLQDLDYWIRACKEDLVIKLYQEPLLKYRSLSNALTNQENRYRMHMEAVDVYRRFFDGASFALLREAFGEWITPDISKGDLRIEIDKAFLFLEHPMENIRLIGIEKLINLFENDEAYKILKGERGFQTKDFFRRVKAMGPKVVEMPMDNLSLLDKMVLFLKKWLKNKYEIIIAWTDVPVWTEKKVKERIRFYMEKGDEKRALMVVNGYRKFPPVPTIFYPLYRRFERALRSFTVFFFNRLQIFRIWLRNFRAMLKGEMDVEELISESTNIDVEGVFRLTRLYDYSRNQGNLVHEAPLEQFYLRKPAVIGDIKREFSEGLVTLPISYIAELKKVTIFGGSNLVLSPNGYILSDDMVDFNTEDFGVKSLQVISIRSENNVLLRYKKSSDAPIEEAIMLSCEHDNNYFHWMVEVLPKLIFIDEHEEFAGIPLLIPDELHENLQEALCRVNITNRPLIPLIHGVAYKVERLIFPSPLSRVVDRYRGDPVFDEDIVLSPKWISEVADILKGDVKYNKKPWRKIYLTRREGLRMLENYEEIENFLSKRGFEIITLKDLSLDDQIKLFSQTVVIVAPTGAALTNMLFCPPKTKVFIFMSDHEVTNFYFWHYLGSIMDLDVTTIVGKRSYNLTNYWSVHDDYIIDADLVLQAIKNETKSE